MFQFEQTHKMERVYRPETQALIDQCHQTLGEYTDLLIKKCKEKGLDEKQTKVAVFNDQFVKTMQLHILRLVEAGTMHILVPLTEEGKQHVS